MDTPGTLKEGEPHPAAFMAMTWLRGLSIQRLYEWQEIFSSCAIEGNRLAEVCSETLRRFMNNEPVSDRYLLGLVYSMQYMTDSMTSQKAIDEIRALYEFDMEQDNASGNED